jgi:hypothetical protein
MASISWALDASISERRIDRFVVFLLEARDEFGHRHDLRHAADALAAAPDFLPGLRLGAFATASVPKFILVGSDSGRLFGSMPAATMDGFR